MITHRDRLARPWAYVGILACAGLMLMSPPAARSDDGRHIATAIETAVIPPGQEDLFAAMLGRGAALPEACAFATGQIERTVVRGVYECPGRQVVVELRHPSAAPANAVRTGKIAIVTVGGTPPASLLAALQERIRQREGTFDWLRPKTPEAAPSQSANFGSYVPESYPRFAAVFVGIAQTTVIVVGLGWGLVRLHRTRSSSDAE